MLALKAWWEAMNEELFCKVSNELCIKNSVKRANTGATVDPVSMTLGQL